MSRKSFLLFSGIWAALLVAGTCSIRAEPMRQESVSFQDAQILVPADQPRFVSRAVEDLQKTANSVSKGAAREGRSSPRVELVVSPQEIDTPEGFIIDVHREAGGEVAVRIAGHDSAGLKFGLVELVALLEITPDGARIRAPLHIERRPLFKTRSMYAHLHWAYRHPYALRSWRMEDWKRYLDLLTHLGFNTIQIWPMMELLPHPLSAEDRVYLERFAEIVKYAHAERGMKVFIGSCPNSITEDARGVPISQREYWDFEKRLNPGDPADLRRLLEARSDLYQTIPDADGYWVIDSDPGGWRGSPPSEFVSILEGHRTLIDRYGTRPAEQPLIYWMWYGWGPGSREENWRLTLTELQRRLREPWRLFVCLPEQFQACRDFGVLPRAIYFPYNLVESEPSGPLTELRFSAIDEALIRAREAGLDAIQGNAQTPLAQLPNIARLSDAAWQDSRGMDSERTLYRLAERLVSRRADVLVRAWQSLAETKVDESMALVHQCRELAEKSRESGSLCEVMGEWQRRIVEDLAYMLEIHAAALRFSESADRQLGPGAQSVALQNYLQAVLAWLARTGYHNDRMVAHGAYKEPVSRALRLLEQQLGPQALQLQVLQPATRAAGKGDSTDTCRLVIETLLGQRK